MSNRPPSPEPLEDENEVQRNIRLKVCAYCKQPGARLKCKACRQRTYCNKKCQKKDWEKEHGGHCKKLQQVFVPPSAGWGEAKKAAEDAKEAAERGGASGGGASDGGSAAAAGGSAPAPTLAPASAPVPAPTAAGGGSAAAAAGGGESTDVEAQYDGTRVEVFRLVSNTAFNGRRGVVQARTRENAKPGRVAVLLNGDAKPTSIKLGNVKTVEASDEVFVTDIVGRMYCTLHSLVHCDQCYLSCALMNREAEIAAGLRPTPTRLQRLQEEQEAIIAGIEGMMQQMHASPRSGAHLAAVLQQHRLQLADNESAIAALRATDADAGTPHVTVSSSGKEAVEDDCPICLETMEPLSWTGTEQSRFLCCGKTCCNDCGPLLGFTLPEATTRRYREAAERLIRALHEGTAPEQATYLQQHVDRQFMQGVNQDLDRAFAEDDKYLCPMCRARLPRTDDEAVALVLKHAKAGKAWAQHNIGYRYENACHGVKRVDPIAAATWFKLAADQGLLDSQHALATCYLRGFGVAQSTSKAKALYQIAAARGNAKAQYQLAVMTFDAAAGSSQKAGKKDAEEAVQLLHLASAQGFPDAMERLAYAYEHALGGCPQSLDQCMHWRTRAADAGDAVAQLNLSGLLMRLATIRHGSCTVVGRSPMPAVMKWLRKSASQGNADAAEQLVQIEALVTKQCAMCGKKGVQLKCGKCAAVAFCSKACQKKQWKAGHKADCGR